MNSSSGEAKAAFETAVKLVEACWPRGPGDVWCKGSDPFVIEKMGVYSIDYLHALMRLIRDDVVEKQKYADFNDSILGDRTEEWIQRQYLWVLGSHVLQAYKAKTLEALRTANPQDVDPWESGPDGAVVKKGHGYSRETCVSVKLRLPNSQKVEVGLSEMLEADRNDPEHLLVRNINRLHSAWYPDCLNVNLPFSGLSSADSPVAETGHEEESEEEPRPSWTEILEEPKEERESRKGKILALVQDIPIEGVGISRNFLECLEEIKKEIDSPKGMAKSPTPFLITGDSGTGKGLFAKAIHGATVGRAGDKNKFLNVDCPAFQETTMTSELFGHKKGAFTGAEQSEPGKFFRPVEKCGGGRCNSAAPGACLAA